MIQFYDVIFRPSDLLCANIQLEGLSRFQICMVIANGATSHTIKLSCATAEVARDSLDDLLSMVNNAESGK